jgi:hypothetical protein
MFMEHDLEQATNMKLLLCAFEQLSGLKINFHKSEMFCYGEAKEIENHYTNLFGCGLGQYPFRYLGIPMHHKKISNVDWKVIEEKFEKKLSCWKGKLLSYGGRLVLINSVLSSLAMFMLSFYEVPKEVLHKLDFYRSRFFWQRDVTPGFKVKLNAHSICTQKLSLHAYHSENGYIITNVSI